MSPQTSEEVREVLVRSKLLGAMELKHTQIYSFPHELYGFPGAGSFALVPAERSGFFWLQSMDFEALTLLLVDPFRVIDGYSVDVDSDELGPVQPDDASDLLVLTVLTLPRQQGEAATVNLQGPLVFNVVERLGKQVVIETPHGIRHPVDLTKAA